jgi:hypothetical protein
MIVAALGVLVALLVFLVLGDPGNEPPHRSGLP